MLDIDSDYWTNSMIVELILVILMILLDEYVIIIQYYWVMLLQYDNPVNDITGLLITGLFLVILDYVFIDHSTSQSMIIGMILWSQCCLESNITIFNPYCCYVFSLSLSI